jgi:two-component system LytT family response regulator
MKRKTICIIDDEFRSRERIRSILATSEEFAIVGEADNGRAAVELIDRVLPDIVLLDIKMPGLSGFQILQEAIHKPSVIFITAYNEHAVKAFEIHAVDYVLKPFQEQRLFDALAQIPHAPVPGDAILQQLGSMVEGTVQPKQYLKRFTVKDRFEFLVIDVENIDYFTTESSLVFLHTKGFRYIVEKSLTQIEETVSPEMFFRAHRKSLVNLNRVERIVPWGRGRYVLQFANDERVQVSKEKTHELKALMGLL